MFTSKRFLGFLCLALTLLLPLFLGSCRVYPDGSVHIASGSVQVPSLIGLDSYAAHSRLWQYRLQRGEVRMTASRTVRQVVIAQNPQAGSMVPVGSFVSYTLGPQTPPQLPPQPSNIQVPSLIGMTQDQATQNLQSTGLTLGSVNWMHSMQPAGTILKHTPAAGDLVLAGSSVAVVLSSGPQVRMITVPSLLKLHRNVASVRLRQYGLQVGEVTEAFSSTVPADCIISQDPPPNAQVREGTPVNLVVASTPPVARVLVPNVVGLNRRQAVRQLRAVGLNPGPMQTVVRPNMPHGQVVGQSPRAGTNVLQGSSVSLTVSEPPQNLQVPKVVGMRLDEAKRVLERAGLRMGTLREHVVAQGVGLVVSQNPAIGVLVPPGSAVNMTVGVRPQGPTVPSVVGLPLVQARTALREAGFSVGTIARKDPGPGGIANNIVLDQNPGAGTIHPRNTRIHLTISWHEPQSVRVPSLRGLTYGDAIEKLSSIGLRVGQVDHRTVGRGQVGKVIDQNPSPNTRVWEGTAVTLVVGVKKKEKLVLVPACLLLSEGKAVKLIRAKGLVAKVTKVAGIPRGRVIFQFPPPGTPVKKGSEVRIHVTQ
ncbi:MAG: PASTA domain-containing protein [Planctomycetota bacterium]